MTTQIACAAGATLVALAFAASVGERWLARRRPHDAAWAVALALFAVAAGVLWLGAAHGWTEPTFRVFYLFGAVLNVPFLALGTIYLLSGSRRTGHLWAAVFALGGAFACGVLAVAPMHGTIRPEELPQGSDVFGALPRILAAVASSSGALIVVGGAVRSAWRLRADRTPTARRLAGGNVLLAAGAVILSASGTLNSVLGEMEAFAITLAAGVAVLFVGFLVASSAAPARR